MDNKSNHNYGVDLIKFIGALFVVMIHVAPFGTQESGSLFYYFNFILQHYLGRLAVPFFFICSGYFFFIKTEETSESRLILAKQKIFQIFKLYLIWSAIYFPISLIGIIKNENGLLQGIITYIRNFLFIGSYAHLWYLNGLIVAFALVMLCLKIRLKPKTIFILSLVLYLIGLLDDSYYGLIANTTFLSPFINFYNQYFETTRNGVFDAFFFFSLGMMIATYKPNPSLKKCVAGFSLSMGLMLIEVILLKHFSIARDHNMYIGLIPASFFLFLLSLKIKLPSTKITNKLGAISRLTFYGHLWVSFAVTQLMEFLPQAAASTMLNFALVLGITLAIALIVIKLSEHKHLYWLKKLY